MFRIIRIVLKNLVQSSQTFSSLESRNYRRYFIGQGISLIGSWMQSVAMSWLVYRLTGSKFLLGFVGFTSQIPSFVFSPFAGVVTDRFNRKKIMLWAQILFMLQAIIFGLLSIFNLIQIWHIISLSILFGIISAFDAPARQALVIDLLDNPKNLGNAIALNSAIFNGARLVGPAIAGIAIALVGEGVCFFLNALSYIAIIVALSKILIKKSETKAATTTAKAQFAEGFKYTFGFKPIRVLLFLLAVISLIGTPFATLMPAYVKEAMKGGSHTYGFLMSAIGAGALIGAFYLASRKTVIGLGKIIVLTSIFLGLGLIGFSLSKSLIVSALLALIVGFCMIATIASINTLIQTLADEKMRGRVMSFYAMALMGMMPFGSLISGSMASAIGLSPTLFISGSITIIVGIWFAIIRPNLKTDVYPVYIKKGLMQ